MPKYQMYFNTQAGWRDFNVDLDEHESLETVLQDILHDLKEKGYVLEGGGQEGMGNILVTWEGRELDMKRSLPRQGVKPNDILRVSVVEEPSLQLRRNDQEFDVVRREDLHDGDEIIAGRTILRFRIGKQREVFNKQATFVDRLRQGQSFKQTVYFMTVVGGIAGLACWFVAGLIIDPINVLGEHINLINFPLLGGFIGGLTVGFNDKWMGDHVVARWVIAGVLIGLLAGFAGGLISLLISTGLAEQSRLLLYTLSWMVTGLLVGFGISLRWLSMNKTRVLHGIIGGMFGGMIGGLAYWSLGGFVGGDVSQALGFILTGVGITFGISIAPIIMRQAGIEFVTSGDRDVLRKYAQARKQWEIHQGGKYVLGSLSAEHTRTILAHEVQIFIPDELVTERHAILISRAGHYYIEPHPELAMFRSASSPK